MSLLELQIYGTYLLFSGVLAVVAILGLGVLLHIGVSAKRELLPVAFFALALTIISGPIISGRNLSGASLLFEGSLDELANSLWVNRLMTLALIALAVERILRSALNGGIASVRGWPLYAAFVAYVVTNQVVNAVWGTKASFMHQSMYVLLVAAAALLAAQTDRDRAIRYARDAILVVLLLSAGMVLIKPTAVIESGYSGGLIGVRYWGLGTHANTLSPLIVVLTALMFVQPYNSRPLRYLAWALAVGSLLATQSKTSIIGGAMVVSVMGIYKLHSTGAVRDEKASPVFLSPIVLIPLIFAAGAVLMVQLLVDFPAIWGRVTSTRAGMEAASLTNRDLIWSYAIAEWERNPLFGYGPGLFGLEYRTLIGIPKAFHAHNQVMQSLGSGGWFGVIGLLLYMGVLAYYAIRAARPTRGLSLALLLFILLRSITEVPLRVDGLMNGEFFVHLLLMMVVLRPARDVDLQGRAMGEEWRSRIRASI